MKTTDYPEFGEVLTATLEIYGAKLPPTAFGLWCGALSAFSLSDVRGALSAYIQTGKFAPKPADIIGLIQGNDGRPGAEESWARLSHAIGDEGATVVLTEEERAAFFVADAIGDDKIAARMAFKEAYTHAVHEARAAGVPVTWGHILGHNPAERETALIEAVEQGKLAAEHVALLLPYRAVPDTRVRALVESATQRKRLSA